MRKMKAIKKIKTGEEGVVSVFVSIMFVAILAVLGLIDDGATIRNNERRLGDIAAQAARAGAQEIDTGRLRTEGVLVIDLAKAKATALATLARENIQGRVDVLNNQVMVTAQKRVELLGGRSLEVDARHTARVVTSSYLNPENIP